MAWTDYLKVGLSGLAGGLANRGTSTSSTPTLPPELQFLQGDLVSRLTKRMEDPGAGLEPVGMGLKSSINQRYSTLPQRLTTSLAKRGFAKSGQLGQGFKGLELARMNELGDVDSKIAELMLSREDATMDLATRLLTLGRGQRTTSSGNVAGGAVGAGIETLSYVDTINKLLGGGAAAGGGATAAVGGLSSLPLSAGGAAALNPALHAGTAGLGAAAGGGGAAAGGGALSGLSSFVASPAGMAAAPAAGLGAAYLLAGAPTGYKDWSNEVAKAYQEGKIKSGDATGTGNLVWLETNTPQAKAAGVRQDVPVVQVTAEIYKRIMGGG